MCHDLREGDPLRLGLGGDVLAAAVGQPDLNLGGASNLIGIPLRQRKASPARRAQLTVVEVGANRALDGLLRRPTLCGSGGIENIESETAQFHRRGLRLSGDLAPGAGRIFWWILHVGVGSVSAQTAELPAD